jgi:hypothetical protein
MAISISTPTPVEVMPGAKAVDPAVVVSDSPEVMVNARCSRLDEIAAAARGIMRSSIRDLAALLREAKALLPHGKFEGWVRRELGVSLRSAENYMLASRFLEGKPETVALLPPGIIYRLAAPSAPPALVADVVAGKLDPREIKKRLIEADHARRQAKWRARVEARAQKHRRRGVTHLQPTAPEPAVAPAHAESDHRDALETLAARLFEYGLARDLLEVLSDAERRTTLAGLLAERDR